MAEEQCECDVDHWTALTRLRGRSAHSVKRPPDDGPGRFANVREGCAANATRLTCARSTEMCASWNRIEPRWCCPSSPDTTLHARWVVVVAVLVVAYQTTKHPRSFMPPPPLPHPRIIPSIVTTARAKNDREWVRSPSRARKWRKSP